MIDHRLAQNMGCDLQSLRSFRVDEFRALLSQTSLQERTSLYAAALHAYTGRGDIWDIGCAAGGSSFCLAAGVQDGCLAQKRARVKCFDLFNGYSRRVFNAKGLAVDDLDLFRRQTRTVSDIVAPVKLDLVKDLSAFDVRRSIELAHIDAAKSLALWSSIFSKLSALLIPGKTIWIFQDFERARLPWQIYSLAELLPYGEIIGIAELGTLYFRFYSPIPDHLRTRIAEDRFSVKERIENVEKMFGRILEAWPHFFKARILEADDLLRTVIAYCHYWQGDRSLATQLYRETSNSFRSVREHAIYNKELLNA